VGHATILSTGAQTSDEEFPLSDAGTDTEYARLPNLFIVGVSKAGTTSLFNYLARHPQVCASDVKEVGFFAALRYEKALGPIDGYARHFAHCEQQAYAMEATPGYFYGGQPLAHGMKTLCPSARVILSLREPIDRCWSWFQFGKSRLRLPQELTFDAYLDRCEELHRAGVDGELDHQPYWGLGGGCYAPSLDAWTDEFGAAFHVLFFDDLVRDPRACVTSLCEWLGIDSTIFRDYQFPVDNKTVHYRNRLMQRAAVSINRRGERFFKHHHRLKRVLRSSYYLVNQNSADKPGMTAAQRARLAEFYRPHNARLATQLAALGLQLPQAWLRAGSVGGS
jgi:Sulfotransferase domain